MNGIQRSRLHRRALCTLGALAVFASPNADAQPASTYPAKPIQAIVTMQAGPLDAFARIMTERLAARMQQPFVVRCVTRRGRQHRRSSRREDDRRGPLHVGAGKLRALAYSGKNRSILAPEVPTMAELGYPGFEIEFAFVLFAPAGTPRGVVEILHREAAHFMKTPELADKFKRSDLSATALPPAESAERLRNACRKWSQLVRDIKLQVE